MAASCLQRGDWRPWGAPHPYLLRDMRIERPDQVWATDVTYIRLRHGFCYLTAVMDWFSRYVLSWELSLTMESWFCEEVVRKALEVGLPEIYCPRLEIVNFLIDNKRVGYSNEVGILFEAGVPHAYRPPNPRTS